MKRILSQLNIIRILWILAGLIIIFGIIYWSFYTREINARLMHTENALASSTSALYSIIKVQRSKIEEMNNSNINLKNILTSEQTRRLELETIKANADKQIDTLTKLTTIDPELLKKYSKVYFLSENYNPPKLKSVDAAYLTDPLKPTEVLENVYPYLMNMLKDADNNKIPILVVSAYRSFEYQKTLKYEYKTIFGAGTANQFSADQGYSEHQLGTTVDFGTFEVKSAELDFQNTTAFKWLIENAYKYGFVISYPKSNTYYKYEPWHWRFVGKQLATDLHDKGKYLYEMDQREIDSYLIKIFD